MKRTIYRIGMPILLATLTHAGAVAAPGADYSRQLKQVDGQTVIAGELDLAALRAAHPGQVLVVDLRTPPEGTAAEAETAAELGLDYTNIPVSSAQVVPDQVAQLRSTLAGASSDTLVVIHCASGNRAGMLWGALQLADGASLTDVQAALSGILTKQPTIDGLNAYARTLDAEQ